MNEKAFPSIFAPWLQNEIRDCKGKTSVAWVSFSFHER